MKIAQRKGVPEQHAIERGHEDKPQTRQEHEQKNYSSHGVS
jgi:hypothetical protein